MDTKRSIVCSIHGTACQCGSEMEDPLLDREDRGQQGCKTFYPMKKDDSREMTELASDTQTKETGKMIKKMDEYDVVTDPAPGRYGKRKQRKRNIGDTRRTKRAITWSNRKLHQTISDEPSNPPPMHTGYHSFETDLDVETDQSQDAMDDEIYPDSINYIQHIYAQERFGDFPHRTRVTATTQQVSFDTDDLQCAAAAGGIQCNNIDGRSSSFTSNEFIPIESVGARDMSTTQALQLCNKYVLKPYNMFLKVIGWRPLFSTTRLEHIACYKRIANFLYPCLMFFMLLVTAAAQALTCFSRSQAMYSPTYYHNDSGHMVIDCRRNIFSLVLFGDILILVAYLWGLYSYRFSNPEHLSSLIATVFISFNVSLVRRSHKRLVATLLCLLVTGVLWILLSFMASVGRLILFHPFGHDATILYSFKRLVINDSNSTEMDKEDLASTITTVVVVVGFVFFDLLYVAVVVNYCSQCQLLCYYVINVTEKIRHKAYALGDAVKEIYRVYEFLRVLNGTVAFITGMVFFVFVQGTITCLVNILQWFSASLLPLILAGRLTGTCKDLKKVCLEVGARPFVYLDTPQLVLDSFILYTLSTDYRAKLGCIPIHLEHIFLVFFILALMFTIVTQFASFQFAIWV